MHLPRLKGVFGNPTAEVVLLHVRMLGHAWAQMIADDYEVALTPIKKQLERFGSSKILKKEIRGRTAIYSFDESCPQTVHVKALIDGLAANLTKHQRSVFARRRQELAPN